MKKKLITLLGLLVLTTVALYAQGSTEIITGIGQGAASGAAGAGGLGGGIGFLVGGPLGALAGAAIGAGIGAIGGGIAGFFTGSKQKEINEEARELEFTAAYQTALDNVNVLQKSYDDTTLDITQSQANLSAFDQSLVRWQDQLDIQTQAQDTAYGGQYQSVLQNWQGTELVNAAKGQTGGSAQLVAEQSKQKVVDLVGSDLQLDLTGGTFGQSMQEFQPTCREEIILFLPKYLNV